MRIELQSEMLMEFDDDVRYKCRFVGFVKDECVIVRVPVVPGIRGRIEPGSELTLRYLFEGNIVSFATESLQYKATPYSLLFVRYPKDLETYELRSEKRVSCRLRGQITKSKTSFKGMLTNLSESGCAFTMDSSQDMTDFIEKDDIVSGEFRTIDGQTPYPFRAKVMRRSTRGKEVTLGLGFEKSSGGLPEAVVEYLKEVRAFEALLAASGD